MPLMTYSERRLVKWSPGTMPLILTCPHDGLEQPPGVKERTETETPSDCNFKKVRDRETGAITEAVAQRILEETGVYPYVVIARFHRKFIDANRPERCAFVDVSARPYYEEYHNRVADYTSRIVREYSGHGFLFDIHGTKVIPVDPADIYLGTANGKALRADFARSNLFLQHGLHLLLGCGRHKTTDPSEDSIIRYHISPANEQVPETLQVSGGFTVKHYGATINSIQIEIADTIRRDPERCKFFVEDLAFALVTFVRRHAPF